MLPDALDSVLPPLAASRTRACGSFPVVEATSAPPPWLDAMERRDAQFASSYLALRQSILKDGSIPAKYKLLMGMITEAVEVAYLNGGTAGLVMGLNAFRN